MTCPLARAVRYARKCRRRLHLGDVGGAVFELQLAFEWLGYSDGEWLHGSPPWNPKLRGRRMRQARDIVEKTSDDLIAIVDSRMAIVLGRQGSGYDAH